MSQHCPVCRARIWTDPLFSPARLHCPRCGAEFSPTVSWLYFRGLLLIVIVLSLTVIMLMTRGNICLFVFLLGLGTLVLRQGSVVDSSLQP